MNDFFFFVDDSGSKDWETPYSFEFTKNSPPRNGANLNFWRGNYFVLAGIHISKDAISKINPEINKIKEDFFGTKCVEIKSDWLRNPNKRKGKYLDRLQITEEQLTDFVENNWYDIFRKFKDDIQIQGFVLDKRFYNSKRNKITPFQELVQVLFDRVELHPHAKCEIVFDQMDSDIKSENHNQGTVLNISRKQLKLDSFQ